MPHTFPSYPHLEARPVSGKPDVGMGLFAKKAYQAGEVVFRLEFWDEGTTELIPWEDTEDEHQDRCTAVAPEWYFFANDRHPFWFLNHACRPTVGYVNWAEAVDEAVPLVALRDIAPGEEITMDYSSMTTSGDGLEEGEPWRMTCLCGAPDCREVLTEYAGMPEARAFEMAVAGQVPAFILAESKPLTDRLKQHDKKIFKRFSNVLDGQRELVDEFWSEYLEEE